VSKDTVVAVTPVQSRISKVVTLKVPQVLADTLILVQASVIDAVGDQSGVREGTIVVFGPPAVTSVSAPTIVRLGELISVRVSAFGARKISQIDVVARGAIQKDTSVMVSPARSNVTQDIVLALPSAAQDTLVQLSVNARDMVGQGSAAVTRVIPLVIEPPVVELVAPPSANAGMSLDVSVHARGVRQISEVRLELRGAVTRDLTVAVSPTQSDVVKNVSTVLPGNILLSDLRVRAAAVDRGGVVAYSDESVVNIPLGPPFVTELETPLAAYNGTVVDVRVRARGDRPLSLIEVRFRGAVDSTKSYTIDPQRVDATQDVSVGIPASPKDSVLVVMATARDLTGAISEIVTRTVSVIVIPDTTTAAEPELQLAAAFDFSPATWTQPVLSGSRLWYVPQERPYMASREKRNPRRAAQP
jgi:hypothetical protein